MAGKSVTFLRGKSDEELAHYFQTSLAFIFPGVDDFGIVAVEALAAGTPVIAYKAGGALDYVEPGQTGEFFSEQTVESLVSSLKKFNPENYNNSEIQKFAAKFSAKEFKAKFQQYLDKATKS
jgi:glycosyltransferase involved in cell wall biosynthesis